MQFVRNMLAEQRKRMVGSLMQHIEAHVYPHLPEAERVELRKKVLSATSAYHDICLDMLKASVNDGSVINDEAVRLLARLNTEVHTLTRKEAKP
jgi:hypothetical protein